MESLNLVSAIIPARNEEVSIARAVESVAAQPEIGEAIVVNDQSTDRTGEILAELAARTPKLRVLATDALPPGWTGKNYAVSIGAAAAAGDWLLFTDADTYHLPGSMRRALSDAAEHNAVVVSYSPDQEMETFWERALIPRVYWMLSRRYSFANVNNPAMPDAAANGQFLLIQRDAYTAIGGHGAVANQVLEDVALARSVKQAGLGLYFASGRGIVQTRMYRSFGAMWEGWTKNLYPLIGSSIFALLGELSGWAAMAGLIFVLSRKTVNPIGWMIVGACVAALVTRFGEYVVFLRRNLLPISLIQYYVPGVCLYSAALIASWWKNTRGEVVWKGRAYPAQTSSGTS